VLGIRRRRRAHDASGVVGTARVAEAGHLPTGRWRDGDVAVLDLPHLDAATASSLLLRHPGAVLLAGSATSTRYPHRGPGLLLAGGVVLVDDLGSHLRDAVRDGTTVRVVGGRVMVGAGRDRWVDTPEPLQGREQDPDSVASATEAASRSMVAQLEAFAETTGAVLTLERELLLEGAGIPEVPVAMAGRPVVVCVPGYGHEDDLRRLRPFLHDRRPVLVGVDAGADALVRAGLRPDVVVTDGDGHDVAGVEAMSSGAHVVVHTRPGARRPRGGRGTRRRARHDPVRVAPDHRGHRHPAGPRGGREQHRHGRLPRHAGGVPRPRPCRGGEQLPHPAAGGRERRGRGHRGAPAPAEARWPTRLLLLLAAAVTVLSATAATPWGQEQLAPVAEELSRQVSGQVSDWRGTDRWPPG
jgi:hypothetical protein